MAKQQQRYGSDTSDALMGFLDGASRFLLWGGILATALGLGFLVYTYVVFAGGSSASVPQALANVDLFMKILLAGLVALGVATSFLFWGEEVLAPLQLIGAAALFFAPFYLPLLAGSTSDRVASAALGTIQLGGSVFGMIAILCTAGDVASRIRVRMREGARADQLKYGKGVKEERDIQNVFMGKCWQLPFCRKFVREKCPIYHARRTCWKERVGCMCEEEVIRNAMEGKVIPKDAVAAANFIPRNTRLTADQKAERCRHCVIYNEHQKHKYKLAMPLIFVGVGIAYFVGREPLKAWLGNAITSANRMFGNLTYRENATLSDTIGLTIFKELLLFCLMLVIAAYLMKMVEFLFFRAKI